ncbi:MAG: MBL fold metallo-hydrolase [Thermoproteota archaeon]
MDVEYVAFDSFGVKSMCTLFEAGGWRILVDPGVAYEVDSFPMPLMERLNLARHYKKVIESAAKTADILVITHYHYDHHICERNRRLYGGKTILLKDPHHNINRSQRHRAESFLETVKGLPRVVKIADGKAFKKPGLRIKFSAPLWHGVKGTNLGYVLSVIIHDGEEKLIYTSDVNGLIEKEAVDLIIRENPDRLILDGPPTYLLGFIMAYYNLARSIINIRRVLDETDANQVILDHHLLRDYRYPDLFFEVYKHSKLIGKRLETASECCGEEPAVLRGYRDYGPTKWKSWKRLEEQNIKAILKRAIENNLISKDWLKMT